MTSPLLLVKKSTSLHHSLIRFSSKNTEAPLNIISLGSNGPDDSFRYLWPYKLFFDDILLVGVSILGIWAMPACRRAGVDGMKSAWIVPSLHMSREPSISSIKELSLSPPSWKTIFDSQAGWWQTIQIQSAL